MTRSKVCMKINLGRTNMKADWDKIYKNNFFSGNYEHLLTPRTEREAKLNQLTRTWRRATEPLTMIEIRGYDERNTTK